MTFQNYDQTILFVYMHVYISIILIVVVRKQLITSKSSTLYELFANPNSLRYNINLCRTTWRFFANALNVTVQWTLGILYEAHVLVEYPIRSYTPRRSFKKYWNYDRTLRERDEEEDDRRISRAEYGANWIYN